MTADCPECGNTGPHEENDEPRGSPEYALLCTACGYCFHLPEPVCRHVEARRSKVTGHWHCTACNEELEDPADPYDKEYDR